MLNLKETNQADGVWHMYTKPEFEIVELSNEDIVSTSLSDAGELDMGGLGSFEWF